MALVIVSWDHKYEPRLTQASRCGHPVDNVVGAPSIEESEKAFQTSDTGSGPGSGRTATQQHQRHKEQRGGTGPRSPPAGGVACWRGFVGVQGEQGGQEPEECELDPMGPFSTWDPGVLYGT